MVDFLPLIVKEKIKDAIEVPLNKGEIPHFDILQRALGNVEYDPKTKTLKILTKTQQRSMNSMSEVRAFFQTVHMASLIYQNMKEKSYATIRDLYYNGKYTISGKTKSWDEQGESDQFIRDLEVILNKSREEMSVVADTKGKISGNISLISAGDTIDARKMGNLGTPLPAIVDDLEFKDVTADYVLVIEKAAIFEKLNFLRWWKDHNCILATGKGQPDRATRRFLRRMSDEYHLPIYVVTDSDPYGFYIYSTYKIGSISLSYEVERLACPQIQFLGVSTSDIYNYKLPKDTIIEAEETDIKRAQELKKYPWFQSKEWQKELDLFLQKKEKVEIEAFSKFGLKYLAEQYLPSKIQSGQFLE